MTEESKGKGSTREDNRKPRVWDKFEKGLAVIGGLCLFLLTFLLFGNVVGRYFGLPITGTVEFTRELMLFAIFWGLGYTQKQRRNVRVELVINLFPRSIRTWLNVIGLSLGFLFFALLTWQGILLALESLREGEFRYGLINVPMYPGRIAVVLGCFAVSIRYLMDTLSHKNLQSQGS